jgi:hypothetical protein
MTGLTNDEEEDDNEEADNEGDDDKEGDQDENQGEADDFVEDEDIDPCDENFNNGGAAWDPEHQPPDLKPSSSPFRRASSTSSASRMASSSSFTSLRWRRRGR